MNEPTGEAHRQAHTAGDAADRVRVFDHSERYTVFADDETPCAWIATETDVVLTVGGDGA